MSPVQTLTGLWRNELGSLMNLTANGGNLTGQYNSAKGNASYWYNLVGLYDPSPAPDNGTSLSWTVQWNNTAHGNSHSNTAWNGQFQANGSTPYIRAMWFLSTGTTPADEWGSIRTGLDMFYPTQIQIAFANERPVQEVLLFN